MVDGDGGEPETGEPETAAAPVVKGRVTLTLDQRQQKAIIAMSRFRNVEYGDLLQSKSILKVVEEFEELRELFNV